MFFKVSLKGATQQLSQNGYIPKCLKQKGKKKKCFDSCWVSTKFGVRISTWGKWHSGFLVWSRSPADFRQELGSEDSHYHGLNSCSYSLKARSLTFSHSYQCHCEEIPPNTCSEVTTVTQIVPGNPSHVRKLCKWSL